MWQCYILILHVAPYYGSFGKTGVPCTEGTVLTGISVWILLGALCCLSFPLSVSISCLSKAVQRIESAPQKYVKEKKSFVPSLPNRLFQASVRWQIPCLRSTSVVHTGTKCTYYLYSPDVASDPCVKEYVRWTSVCYWVCYSMLQQGGKQSEVKVGVTSQVHAHS